MAGRLKNIPTTRLVAVAVVGLGVAYVGYSYAKGQSPVKVPIYAGKKAAFPAQGFTKLKLESAEQVNHNVRRLRFELPDRDLVSGLSTVSSLLTRHTPQGRWIPVFRPYTPISAADEPGYVTFLVKHYPTGKASSYMHSIQPGDTLSVKAIHDFDYKPNTLPHVTLIAGGAGITPFHQLTRTIFTNPDDHTRVTLVYCNHTAEDILLKNEWDELAAQQPGRFAVHHFVSRIPEGREEDVRYHRGRITTEGLKAVVPGPEKDGKVLVCAPAGMLEAVAGAKGGFGWMQGSVGGMLKELGYKKEQVHKF